MESKPKICVSICEPGITEIADALIVAAPLADVIELRLDCLDHSSLNENPRALNELLRNASKPTIVTFRPASQGGDKELSLERRMSFWRHIGSSPESFLDLEYDLASTPNLFDSVNAPDWTRVICSHHDFGGVPADVEGLYRQMAGTQARILKIAFQAEDAIDCLPIFRLLEIARNDGRELIAIGMGSPGLMTRILGPSRGSFLTYAARDNETTTAPGQISARELREIYRIDQIDSQTEIFGVVGKPVSHSLSPRIHNAAFEATGKNAVYIPFEVQDLHAFIRRMVLEETREIKWNLRGLSVTAPHKSAVVQYLDWIEPAARELGAVNTIRINDDGLSGFNTDAAAFLRPLLAALGSLTGLRCAVIGTGGAASAAVWALNASEAKVTVFGRTLEKADLLAKRFEVEPRQLEKTTFEDFDVVVQATPLGTSGSLQTESPVSARELRGARLAYDLVYNPSETEFIRQARAATCKTLGGAEMFLAQAAEQFRIWTGSDAPAEIMRKALMQALTEK